MHHTLCNEGKISGVQQVRQLSPCSLELAVIRSAHLPRRMDVYTAEDFDPDRFIDGRKVLLTSNPFMFLPFNAGPRICLGQQVRKALPPLIEDITSVYQLISYVLPTKSSLTSLRTTRRRSW